MPRSKRTLHPSGFARSGIEAALAAARDRPDSLVSPFAMLFPQVGLDPVPAHAAPSASATSCRMNPMPPRVSDPQDRRNGARDSNAPDQRFPITAARQQRLSGVGGR